jgi:hypothetical protein
MRNILKIWTFLVVALSLLTLNSLALSDSSDNGVKPENDNNEPIGIDICIDFVPYNHEELRDYSDTIVIGTVKEILPPKWNTIDGKQPNKPTTKLDYPYDIIYTDIVISVDEYFKNSSSSKEVIVRITGGTVRDVSMSTDADPSFKIGEKVLLYLSKDESPSTKDIGSKHFIVTDFYRGKYTLTDDGKAVMPDENTTLDELLSTINQTENKENDTGILNDTETASKQEQNSSFTQEPKSIPFMNYFWALAVVSGAIAYQRKTK